MDMSTPKYKFEVVVAALVVLAGLSVIAFKSVGSHVTHNSRGKLPNFVVIVADDMGWTSLGREDSPSSFTIPVLTAMARDGIYLANYYSQEMCTPSRAALLTGRYPLSVGMQYGNIHQESAWGLPLEESTIAQVMHEHGYSTHILGKWNIGHCSPAYLPTSRGFDTFLGYVGPDNRYWTKRTLEIPAFIDFMSSNSTCISSYNGTDAQKYSTDLYTDHAISLIDAHSSNTPLFLYLAYQAVHNPFLDDGHDGIRDEFIAEEVLQRIQEQAIPGNARREYLKALFLLDKNIGRIRDHLSATGLLGNTYVIFMSDNGACAHLGGDNGPLRGSKGTLFEGGTKTDAFIYSPTLLAHQTGLVYEGLMHVTDWFPTILGLAGISLPKRIDVRSLDGVNQVPGWMLASAPAPEGLNNKGVYPRESFLYNMHTHLSGILRDIWHNASFAIRDSRYKLIHTYNDERFAVWYNASRINSAHELDLRKRPGCNQEKLRGIFTFWLFDLLQDPYETTNLYDSTALQHVEAKRRLYDDLLPMHTRKAKTMVATTEDRVSAQQKWLASASHVVPWLDDPLASP